MRLIKDRHGEPFEGPPIQIKAPEAALKMLTARLWQPPVRRCLALRGGWRMNFSGVHRAFDRPLRPRRVSFRVRVAAACASRSYFNVFFSTAAEPLSDEAVFYSGSPLAPPEPPDVFTFLLSTKRPTLPNTFGWPSSPALPDSYHVAARRATT